MTYNEKEYKRKYYLENREKYLARSKKRYQENKEDLQKHNREWAIKNPQRMQEYRDKWAKDNKAIINSYSTKRAKRDYKFALNRNISRAISSTLNGYKNGFHWEDIVDYTLEDLIKHLESKFDKNMSWENRGTYWHIDHIKPKKLFTIEQIRECWALDNLQPLEAKANLQKSDKYEE